MSERLPAFMFAAADFDAQTRHLSAAALGVYIRLLCHQWAHGAVPADQKVREQIASGCRKAWPEIGPMLTTADDGRIIAAWLEAARVRAHEAHRKAKARTAAATAARGARALPAPTLRLAMQLPRDVTSHVTDDVTKPVASYVTTGVTTTNVDRDIDPTPLRGDGGVGEGAVDRREVAEAAVRSPELVTAREQFARRFGDGGDDAFASSIASRLRIATRRFGELGIDCERSERAALATLSWPWDSWSDRLASVLTEAAGKRSPDGWILTTFGLVGQRTATA